MFGVPPIARVGSDLITPVGSSIIIKLLADLQTQLVAAVDETVARVGVASPKTPPTPEAIEEWRNFPLSMAGYKAQLQRLAAVAASVGCEQAVTELMLRWLPPEMGAMLGGVAFQRSQFEYGKFVERLKCLKLGQSGNDKQQKAMQAEEQRNTELVKSVTAVVVCDVLEAILAPRPNREFIMLDPDIGHVCVQLAFHNYQPVEKQQYNHIHPALAAELHQVVVRRWGHVIAHLARSRFDQITNEFIGRMHAAKGSAEEVLKILVGTQRIAIPHLQAPSVVPFIDQYRQIALSSKKEYSQLQVRLCLIYNIEMVVRQIDCGVGEMELLNLYEKIYAIYPPVSTWAEKPELIMAATQLMTLIISHAPTPFWAAHMDVSKEAKQRSNALLGGKKEGLLRELLTHQALGHCSLHEHCDHHRVHTARNPHSANILHYLALAYEEKSARSSLCGVLRLLCGGAPLPHSIIGQPTEVEWWHEKGSSSYEGSLLQHTMRTQENQGGVQGSHVQNPRAERLDFVVEKLFNRKATGRTQRLPYLLENGDVLVYIVGQVAVHSVEVGLKAFEHLLKDPKDLEFNLIGVCSLSRMLKSKELVEVLSPQLKYFADKLMTVVDRCEKEVGYGSSFGEAQVALPFAKMKEDDSVQVMLSRVSKKKDREVAVRLATYREAIACMPLALPEQVVKQPSHFIGQLLVHLDVELATSASRMLQSMMVDQPQYRRDILRCMAKLLCRMLCEPGGKATLRSKEHVAALTGYQNRLLTIVGHISQLLIIWIERLPEEPMALDAYVAEGYVSETVKIEPELIELDAAGFALLGHPSSSLRKEAMKLLSTTKELFYAYKAAYDRAVSDAYALEEFLVGRRSALEGEASRDSIAVVEERRDHVDYIEYFGADVMEMTESAVVRRAIKREMLEEKQGVSSELPTELQLAKMQVPEMKKLLSLDAQALAMSSQVTFCLAELVNGLIFCGCARRVTKLRQLLVATLTGTPFAKDIAGLISEGNNDLGVLWRNCNCMLMMLAGACVPSTRPLMHPDAQIKQPPEPLEEPPAFPSQRGSVLLPDEPTSARREASGYDAASGYERGWSRSCINPAEAAPSEAGPPPLPVSPVLPPPPRLPSASSVAPASAPPPLPNASLGTGQLYSAELGGPPPEKLYGISPPPPAMLSAAPPPPTLAGAPSGAPPPPMLSGAMPPPPMLSSMRGVAGAPSPPSSPPNSRPPSPPPSPPSSLERSNSVGPPGIRKISVFSRKASPSVASQMMSPASRMGKDKDNASNFDRLRKAMGSSKNLKYTRGQSFNEESDATDSAKRQMEVMLAEATSAIRPILDRLWLGMQPSDSASAVGWVSRSVGVIAACLNPQGALMAVESLFTWQSTLSPKQAKEMRLPVARTLRGFAQAEGFREAVLVDANKSEHQRLLQLSLAFVREHMSVLDNPTNKESQPLCLELALLVSYLAKATTTAVRYDSTRWLKPLYIPDSLRNAWPIPERRLLLEQFKVWALWREEEAAAIAEAVENRRKVKTTEKHLPPVGSPAEKLFFRIETVSSSAICAMVASGPIAESSTIDKWLTEPHAPWGERLQRELAWFEKAELEGSSVLRYILAHHFPGLLRPFIERAYHYGNEHSALAAAYFHAVVDAILPPDGVALTEERHAFDDHTFASEVKRVAPKLMLFALFHLKSVDHRIRSRAFDLTCRLTDSFCETGAFECEGPLAHWRALYTAHTPAPVLLNEHIVKLLRSTPQQCRSLGFGLVGEALGLLLRRQPELHTHQVLQLLQVCTPWMQHILLQPFPDEAIHRSRSFAFLRRLAIVGLSRDGVEGEALNTFFEGWMELAGAGIGLARLKQQPPCHSSQECAPHNVEIILEFLLHVSGRSSLAMGLAQKLSLGLFALTPHSIIKLLMSQISRGRLNKSAKAKSGGSTKPQSQPSSSNLFAVIGDTFRRQINKLGGGAKLSSAGAELDGRARQMSVLALSEEPDNNPMLPPAAPVLRGAPILQRVTVALLRPAQGGLGMGFASDNSVSHISEGTPSAECGQIFMGDLLIEINGNPVRPGEVGAAVRAANPLLPIEFTFLRETGEYEGLVASDAPPEELSSRSMEIDDELPPLPLSPAVVIGDEELAALLEPSGELIVDESEREATEDELRHNALRLMIELVRQGFSNTTGKRALLEVLPTLMSALVVMFDSQTRSKLDREEHTTLRTLMDALLEGVMQARRAETGAAIAPFSELREQLPPAFLKLQRGLQTKGFKLRWPRLFADSSALTTTPDVASAFEVTNFMPLSEAVDGLLECVEEWGAMAIASDWALVVLDWLRSNDTVVRFKALCVLRLLLPRLSDAEISDHLVYALVRALYSGLAELQGVLTGPADLSDPGTREALLQEKERVARAMAGDTTSKEVAPPTTVGAQTGRKPPPLALAEEALCTLHEVVKRRLQAGTLLSCPGLIWLPFALVGCPYDALLSEVYPMLVTLLSSPKVRTGLSGQRLATPGVVANNDGGYKPDAFEIGLIPMILRGLHAVGWWGEHQKTGGSGPRKHHMSLDMQPHILQALRLLSSIRSSQLKSEISRGVPAPEGSADLMDVCILQIPAMYCMVDAGHATSQGQRVVFEPLFSAAMLIDCLAGDTLLSSGSPTLQATLDGFIQGDFHNRAFDLLVGLAMPLYAAFLPTFSKKLATLLARILADGPQTYHDPLLLLVATALRQPSAPAYVEHFAQFFQLAIGESSFAATECLTAAMQASQLAGETVTPQVMATGKAFEKERVPPEAETVVLEETRSALPALQQVLGHFSK